MQDIQVSEALQTYSQKVTWRPPTCCSPAKRFKNNSLCSQNSKRVLKGSQKFSKLFLHEWRRHVCGAHRSSFANIMVETPHSQIERKQERHQANKTPKPPNKTETKTQANMREQRSFTSVRHRWNMVKRNCGYLLPGPRIQIQAAVDLHAKRHWAKGL